MNNSKKEEIKGLIKEGFELELISFELDIPLSEIQEIKEEIINKENAEKNDKKHYFKMQNLRQRYFRLFYGDDRVSKETETLSAKDLKIIDDTMKKIEQKIEEMKGKSKEEKREIARNILSDIKIIKKYQLNIEQAEKMISLISSTDLQKLNRSEGDKLDIRIKEANEEMLRNYVKAIDIEQSQTDSIERLNELKDKIRASREDEVIVGALRVKINNKIIKLQQQEARDKIRNNIPERIKEIIEKLVEGSLINIDEAQDIISQEATKMGKSNGKFALTEKQQRVRILNQIKTAIMENTEKYHIIEPETTILQMQQLEGINIEQAIKVIIINLINSKDFERAKNVLNDFSKDRIDIKNQREIINLRARVRNAEIAEFVLKGIYMNATKQEEKEFYELIESGLKRGRVEMSSVFLGKSKDGTRNITLADIWTNQKQRTLR